MMNFYVDADFAGLWVHGNPQEDISDKISTGFVVTSEKFLYYGCQIYRQRFLFILYILIMWNCIIMLETSPLEESYQIIY